MDKKLHIVCWDIPFPADYGGVIDVFYKLKCLHDLGVSIILHCFYYGNRSFAKELNLYCHEVIYYPRVTGIKGLDASLPYIISSRKSTQLLTNLCKDNAPILFEGIHTTYFANHSKLQDRARFLRTHNVEHDYYLQLGENSNFGFKKLYYYWESMRLKKYESSLHFFNGFIEIAQHDYHHFHKQYPQSKHLFASGFHSLSQVTSKAGKGYYCLYHGNLNVIENHLSAMYLVQKVFIDMNIKLIIAGKNPSQELMNCESNHIKIITNPTSEVLTNLISNAHINVLPSFQSTGMKLKLLHALYAGRFCVTNKEMLIGTNLKESILIANNASEMQNVIKKTMLVEYQDKDINSRKKALEDFSNEQNGKRVFDFVFSY